MIKPAICVPIIDSTVKKMKESIEKIQDHVEVIEIRADYVPGITKEDIEMIRRCCKKTSIFTCRHKMEGGSWQGSEKERIELLQHALNIDFDYVDIELDTIKEHAFYKTSKSKIIISFHDFKETPDYWDLTKIIDEMSSYSPDVYKIATLVTKDKDNETLFRLLTNKQGKQLIVAGMGKEGTVTRALSPFLGSLVTFAASEVGSSAPGQIHYKDLQKLYQLIEETI